jgi:hypothetical protein
VFVYFQRGQGYQLLVAEKQLQVKPQPEWWTVWRARQWVAGELFVIVVAAVDVQH